MVRSVKPFVKWPGGKRQLLSELDKRLPPTIKSDKIIDRYVEPFVGGGAFYFFLKNKYQVKDSYLIDINPEIIMAYKVIQEDFKELTMELKHMEQVHLDKNKDQRRENYYKIREEYNRQGKQFNYQDHNSQWISRTAQFIFLNKTGYNGLYRLNSKGEFNVPFGRYKNPKICDTTNLKLVHETLKETKLECADFSEAKNYIQKDTLVYLDPPYRPLNPTAHFTSYSTQGFSDDDQLKLARFFNQMDRKGAYLLLSNSDPKNEDPEDEFFDNLYADYYIERIQAKRSINRNTSQRGLINELLVRNYKLRC